MFARQTVSAGGLAALGDAPGEEEVVDALLLHAAGLGQGRFAGAPEEVAAHRALDGAAGATVIHMCFGYADTVKNKPSGYSFLPELDACVADQISIECAQPDLDLSIVEQLPSKTMMIGVISMGDLQVETPQVVAERIRKALVHLPAERIVVAPDCGMKYLPGDVAFGKLSAMVEGAALVRAQL